MLILRLGERRRIAVANGNQLRPVKSVEVSRHIRAPVAVANNAKSNHMFIPLQSVTPQNAPSPDSTALGVLRRIFRSSQTDQPSAYLRSRRTISSKVVLLLPHTCQSPVMPGFTS